MMYFLNKFFNSLRQIWRRMFFVNSFRVDEELRYTLGIVKNDGAKDRGVECLRWSFTTPVEFTIDFSEHNTLLLFPQFSEAMIQVACTKVLFLWHSAEHWRAMLRNFQRPLDKVAVIPIRLVTTWTWKRSAAAARSLLFPSVPSEDAKMSNILHKLN